MLNNLESGKGGILTGLEMVKDIFVGAPPRQNDREVMVAMTNTWWALTWVWPLVPLLAIFFVFVLCTCCCACGGRAPVAKATPKPKSKSKKI